MQRFRGFQRLWYILKTIYKYLRQTWPMQA